MKNIIFLVSVTLLFSGCANWSGKPNQNIVGEHNEKELIVRSELFSMCGHFDNAAVGQESAVVAAIAGIAIKKVADLTVDAVSSAIDEAAKRRNEAFPAKGNSAAWLYKSKSNPSAPMRCLVIVAGAKEKSANPCSHTDSDWVKSQPPYSCDHSPITESMKRWGIDKPAMYAEILFYSPEPAAPSYVLPKLVYSYYPEPLSSHSEKNLKNTLLTVKATGADSQAVIFDISYQDGQLAPGESTVVPATVIDLKRAPDPGTWLVLPTDLSPSSSKGYGGALNIDVAIYETPNPNKLISLASDIAKESKPTVSTALNDKLSYALLATERNSQRSKEAEGDEALDSTALTACESLDSSVQAATEAKEALDKDSTNRTLIIAHSKSCLSAEVSKRKAKLAWKDSSYKSQEICFKQQIVSELALSCP